MLKFRPYQRTIIRKQDRFMADPEARRATILAATGAGKTEVFQDLIWKIFRRRGTGSRILVVHPRIALSQNQQSRFRRTIDRMRRQDRMQVEFTNFNSGQSKFHTLSDRKNISTTNRAVLREVMQRAAGHHITFSSYASLHKIADMDFDLIIADEAHYLAQPELRQNLHRFNSKTLFYTGTPVTVACAEESMKNPELFGPVISYTPPRMLIPNRYIVRPRVRTVNVLSNDEGNTEDYVATIAYAFRDQMQFAHRDFTHKMLVAMPNTKYFQDIANDLGEIRSLVGCAEIDIYHVTASVAVKNSNIVMDREDLITDFAANPHPAIILHCDTLAEGIDVDGIGGVLIMRELGMVKAIQTIGRGCRPAAADVITRGKNKGEIKKRRIKKECLISIANFNGQWAGDARLSYYADLFEQAGYGRSDFWADLEFSADVGRPTDYALERDVRYKEALKMIAAEGQDGNFWKHFPVHDAGL